jgi:hypothetical protein
MSGRTKAFKILIPFAKRLDNWVLNFGLNLATWQPKKNPLKYAKKFCEKNMPKSSRNFFFMNSPYSDNKF